MSTPANRLARTVDRVAGLPPALRNRLITFGFTRQVRFAGTGGCAFETLAPGRAVLTLENRRRVQNHIGGVHAAAMALLAETASGACFGMTLPDDRLPLLKTMHIDYVRRAHGSLRAEATLDAAQRARILAEPRGDVTVPVRVTDEAGNVPVEVQMVWAWVPRKQA